MSEFYRIVHTRLNENTRDEMLRLRPRFLTAMRARFPDLIDATLIELDDGTWLDVVRWKSPEAAVLGAEAHATIPEAAAMGNLIADLINIYQGPAMDRPGSRAGRLSHD